MPPAASEPAAPRYRLPVNEARGEVRLMIDDVELVLAAEIGKLSEVSSRLQCRSLADLFALLANVELAATLAAVELLTLRGDWQKALQKLKLEHFPACREAFGKILSHHFEGRRGNA